MKYADIYLEGKHISFLETLKASGRINMYEAAPQLRDAFGLSRIESYTILRAWIDSYKKKED